MTREWKPGDVAMLTLSDGEQAVGLRPRSNDGWKHSGRWSGGVDYDHIGHTDARPLVVIDPEDRVQVERLAEGIGHLWTSRPRVADVVQQALRSLLAPPKPDEPTGLGAVVEAINANYFVRATTGEQPWVRVDNDPDEWGCEWEDIAAVRVLSEGVQP